MVRTDSIVGVGLLLIVLLSNPAGAAPNTGSGPKTFDCTGVGPTCGAWAPKGANTCRTCQQAQCKTENGKEVIAGNKTTTECYEGHGKPPARTGGKPGLLNKAPATGGVKQR
jgi:hypothetical protein